MHLFTLSTKVVLFVACFFFYFSVIFLDEEVNKGKCLSIIWAAAPENTQSAYAKTNTQVSCAVAAHRSAPLFFTL